MKAKKYKPKANSDRCLVLRQQFALKMLELHKLNQRIINIDETWLNETSHIRRTWALKNGSTNVPQSSVSPRLSMITALDTDGRVWFTLYHANTDSNIMSLFLHKLKSVLDQETPGWEEDTVLLLDNAPYHISSEVKAVVRALNYKTIYTGPYSYSAAPIETLFSQLKFGELNPERQSTGKR